MCLSSILVLQTQEFFVLKYEIRNTQLLSGNQSPPQVLKCALPVIATNYGLFLFIEHSTWWIYRRTTQVTNRVIPDEPVIQRWFIMFLNQLVRCVWRWVASITENVDHVLVIQCFAILWACFCLLASLSQILAIHLCSKLFSNQLIMYFYWGEQAGYFMTNNRTCKSVNGNYCFEVLCLWASTRFRLTN